MPIAAKCDACSAQFNVKNELAGKKVKCPKCAQPFRIPAAGLAASASKPATKQARPKPAADEYSLAPAPALPAHNPMLDLLDEAGVESKPLGPVCNNCGSVLSPLAIICVDCGFNNETGKQLETTTFKDPNAVDSGMSDGERLLARAEQEIEETPVSAVDQDFGDGADSILIAAVAGVVAVILIGLGVGTILVMDKIGEQVNTPLISFFGSVSIFAFCAVWITIMAFKAKPLHGLACLLSGGLYCIVFGFMQGKALMLPSILCVMGVLIGIISWLVAKNTASAMLLEVIEIVTIV